MTLSDNSSQAGTPDISPDHLPSEFTRAVNRARAAIFWERLWPRIVPPTAVSSLFLSASFAGVWGLASPVVRMGGLMAFTLALAASIVRPPKAFRTDTLHVTRTDALRRLDKNIGHPLNPAQILGDRLSVQSSDREKDIWNLHMSNVWNQFAGKFEAGRPRPGVAARDPYHLRFFIALTLAITAATSQAPHLQQIKQAFDWTAPVPPPPPVPPLQLKAWITPPEGINVPPLQMTEATRDHTQGGEKMIAHQTSMLTIMTYGRSARILVNGVVIPLEKEIPQGQGRTGYQYEAKLEAADTKVTIERGPQWHIAVTQDRAPTVTINSIGATEEKNSKSLDINYRAHDDHGYQGQIVINVPGKKDPDAKPLPSALPPVLSLP